MATQEVGLTISLVRGRVTVIRVDTTRVVRVPTTNAQIIINTTEVGTDIYILCTT